MVRIMSYKTILANLNEMANNLTVVTSAATLAEEFGAHLTGLFVIPATRIYPSATYEPLPEMFEVHREYFERQEIAVKTTFYKVLHGRPIGNDLLIEHSASPLICDATIDRGRACDLVVMSQTENVSKLGVELDFVPRVLVAAGRPAIVVPFDLPMRSLPDIVVIAWDGSREAARATFDSLPILKRARTVHVVRVNPPSDRHNPLLPAGKDIAEALQRQGVSVVVNPIITQKEKVGEALLSEVGSLGAKLIVMGAYGHSRFQELVLGGVTRTMLEKMSCPLLLAH